MNDLESKIDDLLNRGVAEVIDREHLRKRLLAGEKLRVKLGIDPTSPNIHLGRSVTLLKLRDFQELGCQVVFIVGNFTGLIGDTSDKESERPMLDAATVEFNMGSYFDQAAKVLDMGSVEKHFNAEWLRDLGFLEIGEQADAFSVHEFISRENIRKRLDAGKRVSLREVLYPLMQGYDSVQVKADVEIGGTDQRFNILAGRTLQSRYGQEPQDILTVNLIPGTDGRKMSSSWGNTIDLLDEPNDMFGKVMSIPDQLIETYLVHATRISMSEVDGMLEGMKAGTLNPRDAKMKLAKEIVHMYHSDKAAGGAEDYFVTAFSKKEVPLDIPSMTPARETALEGYENFETFIARIGLATSKSDARRKIEQGGVSIGGEKISSGMIMLDPDLHDGKVLKVGKRGFARIDF
ncbi:MAG: tyrosine--tRNA ligase [Candidatus Moranbacteria bacterium]|nr:tyrosine--tRNA ligase [Candidatus Moranbacteria bacterium]